MQCDSGCDDADESSGKWEVFGGPTGPFRMDSRVCKAALIAGVIDGDGGKVSPSGSCIHDNNHESNASVVIMVMLALSDGSNSDYDNDNDVYHINTRIPYPG